MKTNLFKGSSKFFHLNMSYEVTGYFKELDWIRLQKIISAGCLQFHIEVQAFVMLDTHFHLLMESRSGQENFFSEHLQVQLNQNINNSYHNEPITNLTQYLNTYKYIYNNPLAAGLCGSVEKYRFSSIHFLLGFSAGHCLVNDKLGLIQNPNKILNWLNSDLTQLKKSKLSEVSRVI